MAPVTKESAAFAFRGTVKQRGAANLKAITDTARTAVVTVDEIVRSPPALAGFVGHDVTVQLAANEQVRNGERGVFYVTGFVFGETLAVQSVGHDFVSGCSADGRGQHKGCGRRSDARLSGRRRRGSAPSRLRWSLPARSSPSGCPIATNSGYRSRGHVAARERARAVLGRPSSRSRPSIKGGSTLATGRAAFPQQQRCPLAPFAEISGRPGKACSPSIPIRSAAAASSAWPRRAWLQLPRPSRH